MVRIVKGMYAPNNHRENELQYELVLQIMTLAMYQYYDVLARCCGDDLWNCVFMDNVANMAKDFTDTYVRTEWKTYSRDYMLKFAHSFIGDYFDGITEQEIQSFRERLPKDCYYE